VLILRYDQRMTRPERRLVVKVAAVGLAQIVTIKIRSRIGDRPCHHRIVIAVEEIYFLPTDELQGIDIAGGRLGVGLGEEAAGFGRRPGHAGAGRVHHRQRVAVDEVVGVGLGAPKRPAGNHADALDHRRPCGSELNRHERAGRNARYRAFVDVGVVAGQPLLSRCRAHDKSCAAKANNDPAQHSSVHATLPQRNRDQLLVEQADIIGKPVWCQARKSGDLITSSAATSIVD
jgi:hypothetical protein